MYFKTTLLFSLAVSALALPTTEKRAGVLTKQAYADFQISDGVAGNALAEVQAKFPIDENDLANVDPADVAILTAARTTAEDAETETGGFNDAIAAASGTAADALQVGKIKNKVLKLKLEVLNLQIDQAQNGKDNTAKIAAEQKKLDTNIATDTKSAGQTSQSVNFTG
ncbi:hypothetical protein N0V93_001233 [Gnomoniopsis smithogilvyi]|uniref:Small secreted protein n=1 Tax=Gnomoniopsis smithogilvyi TaxID=1191159 RepID=A0A9W9D221_9PEZI|nr:hypothetical protein N0V93_001233 [Gnomoniopsis smithogilvyi]